MFVEEYIGTTVVVYWPEEEQWFEGTIRERGVEDGKDGLIVIYEDGDHGFIDGVSGNPSVKVLGDPSADGRDLVAGTHVKCLYDNDEWFRGWILARTSGGLFEVKFEDGDFRDDVPLEEMKVFALVPAEAGETLSRTANSHEGRDSGDSPESDEGVDGVLGRGSGDKMEEDRSENGDGGGGDEDDDDDAASDAASDAVLGLALDVSGYESAGCGLGSSGLQSSSPQRSSAVAAAASVASSVGLSSPSSNLSHRGGGGLGGGGGGSAGGGGGRGEGPAAAAAFSSWAATGPRQVHPAFVPRVDSPAQATVLSLALEASASSSAASPTQPFRATTTATATTITKQAQCSELFLSAGPGVRLAELHLRAAALEQTRWDREMCGAAWEGADGSSSGQSTKATKGAQKSAKGGKSNSNSSGSNGGGGGAVCAPGASDTAWRAMDMKVLRHHLKKNGKNNATARTSGEGGGRGGGGGLLLEVDACGGGEVGAGAALWEALLQVRMRAIALVKLHHGASSNTGAVCLPLVQASVELAKCYALQGLWQQARAHTDRACRALEEVVRAGDADGCVRSFSAAPSFLHSSSLPPSLQTDLQVGDASTAAATAATAALPPTGASVDCAGMQKVAQGVLAVFDALRSCAAEFHGRVPWDNLVGMVGEDDVESQGHRQGGGGGGGGSYPGAAGAGNSHDSDAARQLYAVQMSTPYGTRQNLPPQHVLAAAATAQEANRLSAQGAPHSGVKRFDPTGNVRSSSHQGGSGGGGNLGQRVSTKSKTLGGAPPAPPLRRSMTWGEAVAFLRLHHPNFKKMAATLEGGVRQDHLALLSLAFSAAAAPTTTATESAAAAAATTTAVVVVPLPPCTVAGGSVAMPSALVEALEKTPSCSKEFGQRGVAKMSELLCERISSITVKLRTATTGGCGGGGMIGGDEGEDDEQGVGLPVTWEEVVAVFVLAAAHEAAPAEEAADADENDENDSQHSEAIGGGGGSTAGKGLGDLSGGLAQGLGVGGGRYKGVWVAKLRCELALLEGQCFSASGLVGDAEKSLGKLQTLLGEFGWQDSLSACEGYTCMAELCVVRHVGWRAERLRLANQQAEAWLASDQGHGLWRSEVKRLLQETRQQHSHNGTAANVTANDVGMAGGLNSGMVAGLEQGKSRLTRLELEYRVRQALLKAHADKVLAADPTIGLVEEGSDSGGGGAAENKNDNGGDGGGGAAAGGFTSQHFDRAEEFLLRVWEIHESTLGREHPGTAAACLSLGNLCVINRDLAQARLWFESAVAILDACFSNECVQVTAATEAQFGQVEAKLGKGAEAAAPHLERAAGFYLARAKEALAFERRATATTGTATIAAATASTAAAALPSEADLAASVRRRVWLAKRSHSLWTTLGLLWFKQSQQAKTLLASSQGGNNNADPGDIQTNEQEANKAARAACKCLEKALSSVGCMHDRGGEASSEGLRLLLASLKQFGEVLEQAKNWRRAADAYGQLNTLSARLLGQGHRTTKNAAEKARRAASKAANQPALSGPARSSSSSGRGGGAGEAVDSAPFNTTRDATSSPIRSRSNPKSPVGLTGTEDWLN